MTSDSPSPDRPVFKTPDPASLQSEETREVVQERYGDQPEANLTDFDRISQQGDGTDASDDESATPIDLQIGIVGRTAD